MVRRYLYVFFVLTVVFMLLIALNAVAQTTYTITDLGTAGWDSSQGAGINNSGQITGFLYDSRTYSYVGFLYSNGAMWPLNGTTNGTAINESGQVTGTDAQEHAFFYSPTPTNGTVTDLGTLGGSWSGGLAINYSGQVVGTAAISPTCNHAFLYSSGFLTDIDTFSGGCASTATGINDSGQVVGAVHLPGGTYGTDQAFSYTNGVMSLIGGDCSGANATNNSGQIVGYFYAGGPCTVDPSGAIHAFLYSSGKMMDLGTLPDSSQPLPVSQAVALNNLGQVTGFSSSEDGLGHAFLYTPETGMVDLNTLLPSGSGWVLVRATGINDAGQITGAGVNPDGKFHAFLLSPSDQITVVNKPTVVYKPTDSDVGLLVNGYDVNNDTVWLMRSRVSSTSPVDIGTNLAPWSLSARPKVIAFGQDRSPTIADANWTAGRDNIQVTMRDTVSFPVALWLLYADNVNSLHQVESVAAYQVQNANSIWFSERAGLRAWVAKIQYPTSHSGDTSARVMHHCDELAYLKQTVGYVKRMINVYYVGRLLDDEGHDARAVTCFSPSSPSSSSLDVTIIISITEATLITLAHEFGHAFSLNHPFESDVKLYFSDDNIMSKGEESRQYLSEGQTFRMQYNMTSALNFVYNAHPMAERLDCGEEVSTTECPSIYKRIWADGSQPAN